MTVELDIAGFAKFAQGMRGMEASVESSARIAINDGARFATRVGAKAITDDLNLTSKYLTGGPSPRLGVSRFASDSSLEAVVTGRDRPTSLARFARGAPVFGHQKRSPTVKVNRAGAGQRVNNSFFVRLRSGKEMSADNYNVGIAVRLKPGETIRGKNVMARPGKRGFYLLYGPSVGQAYRTASEKTAPAVAERVTSEFLRQLARSK